MSARDIIVTSTVIGAFALLLTLHVAIAAALSARRPRWRALVALLVPPFAPYFAFREKMRARGWAWLAACAVYATGLALAWT